MIFRRVGGLLWIVAGLVSFLFGSLEVPELYVRFVAGIVAIIVGASISRLPTRWSTVVGLGWVALYAVLAALRSGTPDAGSTVFGSFFWLEILSAVLGGAAALLVWAGARVRVPRSSPSAD